jgi:glycosyltransferase involved in cell wall biosynthesis
MFITKKLVKEQIAHRIPGSGIDTQKYIPKVIESDAFIFLLIARLIKDKGIMEYIEAIKLINKKDIKKPIRFKIIGGLYESNPTAVTKAELQEWVDDGLIKHIDHTDHICQHIAKASCVVLPSYREGLSRSLLEATSMAKPIVTTDVSGCRDLVDDGINGYLCKPKDHVSLANAMLKILELSDKQREEMGKKGREKVLHDFSDDVIIEQYSSIIQETLNL